MAGGRSKRPTTLVSWWIRRTASTRTVVGRGLVETFSAGHLAPSQVSSGTSAGLRNWALTISDWLPDAAGGPATIRAGGVLTGDRPTPIRSTSQRPDVRSALVWTGRGGAAGVIKKSPSLEAATRPLHEWQRGWPASTGRLREVQGRSGAMGEAPKADRGEKPQPPRLWPLPGQRRDDGELAEILGETPRGILQERDELIGWVNAHEPVPWRCRAS